MSSHDDYLVSYGLTGQLGRFHADQPLALRRGDRVVIRSERGLELGSILRPSAPGHGRYLPESTVGRLLRRAPSSDQPYAQERARRAEQLFARAGELARALGLSVTPLDAEVLLDDRAVL